MTNDWMKDEALKGIDPSKLEFLQAVAKRGQEKKISFSDQEMDAIISVLKKHASPEEIGKMEKVLAMRSRMGMR